MVTGSWWEVTSALGTNFVELVVTCVDLVMLYVQRLTVFVGRAVDCDECFLVSKMMRIFVEQVKATDQLVMSYHAAATLSCIAWMASCVNRVVIYVEWLAILAERSLSMEVMLFVLNAKTIDQLAISVQSMAECCIVEVEKRHQDLIYIV